MCCKIGTFEPLSIIVKNTHIKLLRHYRTSLISQVYLTLSPILWTFLVACTCNEIIHYIYIWFSHFLCSLYAFISCYVNIIQNIIIDYMARIGYSSVQRKKALKIVHSPEGFNHIHWSHLTLISSYLDLIWPWPLMWPCLCFYVASSPLKQHLEVLTHPIYRYLVSVHRDSTR